MAEAKLDNISNNPKEELEPQTSSNKSIAKNALALYVRMFLSMIVGLYTSRVVLATLGVEDFGIYGVVGGVVGILGFLNASMSGATSRFLTFELGRGDQERLEKTFSSALIIHVCLAIVVLVLAETVGLWFLENKLVIPEHRMNAARWVYQLSIISAMFNITQVPYNSSIIAHEKMDVYAYVEILHVVLKLLIVYLLLIGNFDKLILYAWLYLAVSIIIILVYRIYCIRKFSECHFHWIWDKSYLKPMLSFSGWNVYGNFGTVANQQGNNFVINFFYGVIYNAAFSVALTLANYFNLFAMNVMTAFRPQIIKTYATSALKEFEKITVLAIKIILIMYSLVGIPAIIEAKEILIFWLKDIPPYSPIFCQIMIVSTYFEILRYTLNINIHAHGNIKLLSFFIGTFLLISVAISYFLLKIGLEPLFVFIALTVCNIILCIVNLFLIKKYIKEIKLMSYVSAIIKTTLVVASTLLISWLCIRNLCPNFIRLIITTCLSITILIVLSYFFCLDSEQRIYVKSFVKSKMHHK